MTIRRDYQNKKANLEDYCREGMTAKQIAKRVGVTPRRLCAIFDALGISLLRLRHEGYNDAK